MHLRRRVSERERTSVNEPRRGAVGWANLLFPFLLSCHEGSEKSERLMTSGSAPIPEPSPGTDTAGRRTSFCLSLVSVVLVH